MPSQQYQLILANEIAQQKNKKNNLWFFRLLEQSKDQHQTSYRILHAGQAHKITVENMVEPWVDLNQDLKVFKHTYSYCSINFEFSRLLFVDMSQVKRLSDLSRDPQDAQSYYFAVGVLSPSMGFDSTSGLLYKDLTAPEVECGLNKSSEIYTRYRVPLSQISDHFLMHYPGFDLAKPFNWYQYMAARVPKPRPVSAPASLAGDVSLQNVVSAPVSVIDDNETIQTLSRSPSPSTIAQRPARRRSNSDPQLYLWSSEPHKKEQAITIETCNDPEKEVITNGHNSSASIHVEKKTKCATPSPRVIPLNDTNGHAKAGKAEELPKSLSPQNPQIAEEVHANSKPKNKNKRKKKAKKNVPFVASVTEPKKETQPAPTQAIVPIRAPFPTPQPQPLLAPLLPDRYRVAVFVGACLLFFAHKQAQLNKGRLMFGNEQCELHEPTNTEFWTIMLTITAMNQGIRSIARCMERRPNLFFRRFGNGHTIVPVQQECIAANGATDVVNERQNVARSRASF